jgi:hypothetical protein
VSALLDVGVRLRPHQLAQAGSSAGVLPLKAAVHTKIDFERLLQHLPHHLARDADRARALGDAAR